MYKFLVADDHPLFRDALISVIRGRYEECEILQSEDIERTLVLADEHSELDLILLDLNMPGMAGLKGLLELRNQHPTIPIAIISAETNKQIILQTIAYGAVGFIAKSASREKMREAFEQILDGHVYLPADIIRAESDKDGSPRRKDDPQFSPEMLHTLTRRQLLVLKSMAQGSANKQIAYELSISETTVKSHVSAILKKLGVHNRIQAVVGVTNIDFDRYLKR
ncbi:DNA-binding response regulator [Enterovibrio norvegicus FF-33]|uniref:DNA-binding response regulator n=1 Tax=Enterovibrio norvegicus FF-454 TaxID=1185651 RepID=A0A1E5C4V2_9GAMM|nr:response regulator transcription factor [Enterovibrio norvegicus]OEE60526.1 DNA-binding response regulator [Enterovibrio norvegicus FF-454]OEE71002.1 DNA-binding response regulator [Enterovibrio norvegicus FF-33]OEE81519.1 DNA-binding response regulator [Enterovibrio norvegicus FF-162]